MVDAMTRSCDRFIRILALLLAGTFAAAGCGSANGDSTTTSAGAQAAAHEVRSGIVGETVALVCGGASSDGQSWRHRPVPATVVVLGMPSQRQITAVQTDSSGRFRVDLPPGTYKLEAHTSSVQVWARAVTASVRRHQVAHVRVTFVPRHPLPVAPGSASG
jgi:hypothetical protein